jgi:hypothetical protein
VAENWKKSWERLAVQAIIVVVGGALLFVAGMAYERSRSYSDRTTIQRP